MLFLLISPALCRAQCAGPDPTYFAPGDIGMAGVDPNTTTLGVNTGLTEGQTTNVVLYINGPGSFEGCTGPQLCPAKLAICQRFTNGDGWIIGPQAPDLSVSNFHLIDATHAGFTATASGEPSSDQVDMLVLAWGIVGYSFPITIQSAPPPPPPPPPPPTCATQDSMTIASVTPSNWVAGKSNNITITGTCFNEAIGVYAATNDGTAIDLSKFKVVNPAEITVTAKPAAGEPAQAAYLMLQDAYEGATETTVQIVACDTPAITEIKPGTWFAGKTYDHVVIKGTGFTTQDKATAACPVTAVNITAADNSTVPVSNVSVDSKDKITLSVAPPASDPTESVTVTVGTAPNTATATAQIVKLKAIVTDTSDIMDGVVTVKLTAPSGTSGDLDLYVHGENYDPDKDFANLSPGSQKLDLDLEWIPADIYSTADGTWNATVPDVLGTQAVSIPEYRLSTQWGYFRLVRFTQYNTPNEGAAGGGACKEGKGRAWLVAPIPGTATGSVKKKNYKVKCTFEEITDPQLNAQFIQQTWINGTGISISQGYLQNAVAQNLGDVTYVGIGCTNYPNQDVIGYGPNNGNTFAITSPTASGEVTGACGPLVPGESAAAPTRRLSGVIKVGCGTDIEQLNMDDGHNNSVATRTIADICPDCNKTKLNGNADGHIDSYTGSDACTGHATLDLPGSPFYTSNMTNQ